MRHKINADICQIFIMKEVIEKISSLAYISLTEEEKALMASDFERIFHLINDLKKCDLSSVGAFDIAEEKTPMRKDEAVHECALSDAMSMAIDKKHDMFAVPKFL